MTNLADTSIPHWLLTADGPDSPTDTSGVRYLLIGVGAAATPVLTGWLDDLAGAQVRSRSFGDVAVACTALAKALSAARVGVRVMVAGPPGACLKLRAQAIGAGLEDDEFTAVTAGAGPVEVFCVHCRGRTLETVAVGETVPCAQCQRSLVVYHHVSRRSGRFMGFMADAEVAT